MENNQIIEDMVESLANFYMCKSDRFYETDQEEREDKERYIDDAKIVVNIDAHNAFAGIEGIIKIELRKVAQLKDELTRLEALIKAYKDES